jgi:hypothetical protein
MTSDVPVKALEPWQVFRRLACGATPFWQDEAGWKWRTEQFLADTRPSTEAIPQGHDAWVEAADGLADVVERLCDAIERQENDIGGESVKAVLQDLGPAYDRYRARAVAAVTLSAGGEGLVKRIAQFVRDWNGATHDGDTFLIADEIEEQFASLTAPASEPDKYTIDAGKIVAAAIAPDERVRVAVDDAMIDAALHARVPGGAEVWCWLPQQDAWTPHETARDVMRAALGAALATLREIKP